LCGNLLEGFSSRLELDTELTLEFGPLANTSCILLRLKNYVDVCSKDMISRELHVSRHPKGIRNKTVRGNDLEPGHEEVHKLHGSRKSRKETVRPNA